MKKYLVVTSFSESGYKNYGRRMIDSFIKFWPKSVELVCYHHSDYPITKRWEPKDFPKARNITYFNLDTIKEVELFKDNAVNILKSKIPADILANGTPWQLDAVKFTNKVFGIQNANVCVGNEFEWLIWLDADTVTTVPVKNKDIERWLSFKDNTDKPQIVHLGRSATYYSETSFMGFRISDPVVRVFLDNLMSTFLSGEFQFYTEWHDGFIFERLLNIHKWHGLVAKNLNDPDCKTLEAFKNSDLGKFMAHFKGNLKNQPAKVNPVVAQQAPVGPFGLKPFLVKPTDCVPQKELKLNIENNLDIIGKWCVMLKPHDKTAIVASAGPSLKKNLKYIKKRQAAGASVFCVKHSYPTLIDAGITPDYVVILDPREIDGVSTHGFVRKDLFKNASNKTKYMIASMTHPSVTKHFLERGFDVYGWHATTGEFFEVLKEKNGKLNMSTVHSVKLGTCSAIRAIGLAELMGFRNVEVVGFDSSLETPPLNKDERLDTGVNKYFQVSLLEDNTQIYIGAPVKKVKGCDSFWTTGELVALYQDFMSIMPFIEKHMSLKVISDDTTLCGAGWKRYKTIVAKNEKKSAEEHRAMKKNLTLGKFFKTKISCYNR